MQIIVSFLSIVKLAKLTVICIFLTPKEFWLKYENCTTAELDVILSPFLKKCCSFLLTLGTTPLTKFSAKSLMKNNEASRHFCLL